MEHTKCIVTDLARYIGRTVTIFTTSGGISGDPYYTGGF